MADWSRDTTDNVDYDDLKYLIKLHTTGNPTEAQPIPNGKPETLRAHQLEDQLFEELERQHARVNDFVQVKSGEVSRRLSMCMAPTPKAVLKH